MKNNSAGWEPTHRNWFLHPVEGPKRFARQRRRVREWLLFFWRRITGQKPAIHAVNVGGGPRWCRAGWLNLEEVTSVFNPTSFKLGPTCRFPLADGSVRLVYTSHCLEHLDDATVDRVFSEARRVLRPGGRLLVKIPDFDEVLERWKRRDENYFSDYRFFYESMRPVWRARGVEENIDMKSAFVFCHYWNRSYGHHYAEKRRRDNGAYIGPPLAPAPTLAAVSEGAGPHEVSRRLRELVTEKPDDLFWGHQNAWGREELRELLKKHGFSVDSFDREAIIRRFRDVPNIDAMDEQSLYCLAVR